MNSLIACLPYGVTVEEFSDELEKSGIDVDFVRNRLSVSYGGSHAWIEVDSHGELEREYEPDERALIKELIGVWVGFIIDYRTQEAADAVVAAVAQKWPCVVDDEAGFLGLARDYFER
ncbi:hypothetical protein [Streptomyces sp. NPDC006012]|uniref:hypothetical protein n=1 Tax=Streptomyces sp. NPDC006012 TaxID=3364739 RepID=UPI0036C72E88